MQAGYATGWRIFGRGTRQPMVGSRGVASTSALEEWERLVERKQEDDLEMEREEPHPLRTQEWRLEASAHSSSFSMLVLRL